MTTERREVQIVGWPEGSAKVEHAFKSEQPCPVRITFQKDPVNVNILTTAENPINVNMNMNVSAKQPIPVCVKLCEPICAKSDYTIGIELFDRPIGAIRISGLTKLFNCNEDKPQAKPTCVDFSGFKVGTTMHQPVTIETLTFTPAETMVIRDLGAPQGRPKLVFQKGVRIDFPFAVRDVTLFVNNYAEPDLEFTVYAGGAGNSFVEQVDNTAKEVSINEAGVTAVAIRGGDFEASLIQVCYYPF